MHSYRVYTKVLGNINAAYRVCAKVYLKAHSPFLKSYRVYTKIYREWTKAYRVCTKMEGFPPDFLPWLRERRTVFARKGTVRAQKFYRVCTKFDRGYTKKPPCLNERELPKISETWLKNAEFRACMYVCILFNKKILTTTYIKSISNQNRVCTKEGESL